MAGLTRRTYEMSRDIKELHRQAAEELGLAEEAVEEVERLLSELQQLLVGISIMQVRRSGCPQPMSLPKQNGLIQK